MLLVLIYVDDILITGADQMQINQLISDLNKSFALKTLGSVNYFLEFEAYRDQSGVHLTQTKYIHDLLVKTKMDQAKPTSTSMCSNQKLALLDSKSFDDPTVYRSTIGALQYLTMTRPDISFAVNKLSQYLQAPTVQHWSACKHVLRYLKGTSHLGLHFTPAFRMNLECFLDANWASNLDDRRSTSGHCVFLRGNLIYWSSKKQKVVAKSSAESEYRSLSSAATEVIWLQSLFMELNIEIETVPISWCDNTATKDLSANPVFHSRTKHIEVDIHFIREKVAAKELEVRYIPTDLQKVDIFTKALSTTRFCFLRKLLSLEEPQFSLKGNVSKQADMSSQADVSSLKAQDRLPKRGVN